MYKRINDVSYQPFNYYTISSYRSTFNDNQTSLKVFTYGYGNLIRKEANYSEIENLNNFNSKLVDAVHRNNLLQNFKMNPSTLTVGKIMFNDDVIIDIINELIKDCGFSTHIVQYFASTEHYKMTTDVFHETTILHNEDQMKGFDHYTYIDEISGLDYETFVDFCNKNNFKIVNSYAEINSSYEKVALYASNNYDLMYNSATDYFVINSYFEKYNAKHQLLSYQEYNGPLIIL